MATTVPTWEICPDCMKHGDESPFIVEVCSSVAIESGQSPYDVAVAYFKQFHDSGHKER
jgi:hypothetical protein